MCIDRARRFRYNKKGAAQCLMKGNITPQLFRGCGVFSRMIRQKGTDMEKFRLPKCLAALTLAAGLTVTNAAAFTDTEGHWAETAISKWSENYGLITGY